MLDPRYVLPSNQLLAKLVVDVCESVEGSKQRAKCEGFARKWVDSGEGRFLDERKRVWRSRKEGSSSELMRSVGPVGSAGLRSAVTFSIGVGQSSLGTTPSD